MPDPSSTFQHDALAIQVTHGPTATTLLWRGVSDARDPATHLMPFVSQLMQELAGKTVTLDFRALEFMNSSTVSVILRFIKRLDAAEIKTVVLYDTKIEWQRVNFVCMRTIARTLPQVEVRG